MNDIGTIKKSLLKDIEQLSDQYTIDRLYQTLHGPAVNRKIYDKVCNLWGNTAEAETFSHILYNTNGSFSEKKDFAENLGKSSFISINEITKAHTIQSFETWFNGNKFSYKAFLELCNFSKQGIGAGEVALSVFEPSFTHLGRSQESGDVKMNNSFVEIKARCTYDSPGGRLQDQAKSMYDMQTIQNMFNTFGYTSPSLRGSGYVKDIRPQLSVNQRITVADTVVDSLFKYTSINETTRLKTAIAEESIESIKKEWGTASFYNYQHCSNFDAMLLFDIYEKKSLYITDFNQVKDKIQYGSVVLYGNPREAMPQLTIKKHIVD